MNFDEEIMPSNVLHWNYRGFTEFPFHKLEGDESSVTDIYLKENLISRLPSAIARLENLESLYLSGNDIKELPGEISKLRSLKCLDVSGNRLRFIPDQIGDMRGLKFLILDENELHELPLRISELRALRYLSVCDNKLQWLPQRPVYNYHLCEFRFWRNGDLTTIPYSLWYHMFRGQQIKSFNIGCLDIEKLRDIIRTRKHRLKFTKPLRKWTNMDIPCPSHYRHIFDTNNSSPPSLYELCKRSFYQNLCKASRNITNNQKDKRFHTFDQDERESYKKLCNLRNSFQEINITQGSNNIHVDENGNTDSITFCNNILKQKAKLYTEPADIIEELFNDFPKFLKSELSNGPVSKCENTICQRPIFDYAHIEYCLKNLVLIDNTQEIIVSANFCSKLCAEKWKRGNIEHIASWEHVITS